MSNETDTMNTLIDPIIAACLFHADAKLGPGPWSGSTPEHAEFIEAMPHFRDVLNSLPEDTVEAIGSTEAADINAFLRERGYDIALNEQPPPSLYLAAVLDLLVKWREPGERSTVWVPSLETRVPGVKMERGKFETIGPVLSPHAEGSVRVVLTESDNLTKGLVKIKNALTLGNWSDQGYEHAEFPTVELDVEVDITKAMGLTKGDARVTQAVARAKLRLDELGAHAEAAAAMAVMRGMSKSFSIAGPFTIAFVTDTGIAIAFHVGTEHFVAPRAEKAKDAPPPTTYHRNIW